MVVTAQHDARWRVVLQTASDPDATVCRHRFGLLAELCAHRRQNRTQRTGEFYNAYPAETAR